MRGRAGRSGGRDAGKAPGVEGLGAAISIDKYQGSVVGAKATLLKVDVLVDAARAAREAGNDREGGMYEALEKAIVGVIEVGEIEERKGECRGAWEVKTVAGPRYGEVLYGVGFALSPRGLLTSDRMNVSKAAIRVWQRQEEMGRRRQAFEPLSARTSASCVRFPKHSVLNYAYEEEGWEKPLTKKMKLAGITAMTKAKTILRVDARSFEDILTETSWNFWAHRRPSEFALSGTE